MTVGAQKSSNGGKTVINAFISAAEKDIVVFMLWKSLGYSKRIGLSFLLILTGLMVQYFTMSFFIGAVPILVGNLLLVVKGYDNRVNDGKFDPQAGWEKVDSSKFNEVERLHKDMKKWDRSFLDITNPLGLATLAVISLAVGIFYYRAFMKFDHLMTIICYDAALLLLPHWFTGIRSTLTKPNLILKIKKFKMLIKKSQGQPWMTDCKIDYYMMLAGDEAKIPDDVKIRIRFKNQHEDFLGLYGQIVTNEVSGTAYPYFYVVLVTKIGYGLKEAYQAYDPPSKVTKEIKTQGDVQVFVIRQTTTKTSGYHTKDKKMVALLKEGVELSRRVAVK
jgi:hypothetical protein